MSELLEFLTTHEDNFRRNRLAALYSDFRHLHSINPDGYTANIEAWQRGLAEAAKGGHIRRRGALGNLLTLDSGEELLRSLETKEWGRPLALGAVVRDAISKREMIPLKEFLTARESVYHKAWAIKPWDIVSWSLKQLGLGGGEYGEDKLPVGDLVILANVESTAKELFERIAGLTTLTDRIYSKRLFYEVFASVLGSQNRMTQSDMEVLLKFMARDRGVLAYDGQTIKLKGVIETGTLTITPEDSTIASLKTLMADLRAQVDALTLRVETLSSATRGAISRGNKISALAALRSKKLIESNLSRQSATLGQLEEVYAMIGQAADQVELVRIMESSTGVLKTLNAEVGGAGVVDEVVYELKEQMAQVEEVGNTLTEVGQGVTASEVEDELEIMEREERQKAEEAERAEKQERELEEVAEIKLKLERLEAAERQAALNREDPTPESSAVNQSLDRAVNEMAANLDQMSLDRQRSEEKAI